MSLYRKFTDHDTQRGQGLVEYALILVLVAVVVIVVLIATGGALQDAFCDVVNSLSEDNPEMCQGGTIAIASTQYNNAQQRVTIRATVNGGYDPAVTLVASPGGAFSQQGNQYRIIFNQACPCDIALTASNGDTISVSLP